jgi:hypothetical protein
LTREYGIAVCAHRQKSFHVSVVVYQYQVNDNTYQSQTIMAGDQFMNIRVTGEAQATVARYPRHASGMVRHNPEKPAGYALER